MNVGILLDSLPYSDLINNKPIGMTYFIWDMFAKENNISYQLVWYKTYSELVDAVEKNQVEIGLGAFSVTTKRMNKVFFTRPFSYVNVYFYHVKNNHIDYSKIIRIVIPFLILFFIMVYISSYSENKDVVTSSIKGLVDFLQVNFLIHKPKDQKQTLLNIIWTIIAFIFSVGIIGYLLTFFIELEIDLDPTSFKESKVAYQSGTYYEDLLDLLHYPVKKYPISNLKQGLELLFENKVDAIINDQNLIEEFPQYRSILKKTKSIRIDENSFIYNQNFNYSQQLNEFIVKIRENNVQRKLCDFSIGRNDPLCNL